MHINKRSGRDFKNMHLFLGACENIIKCDYLKAFNSNLVMIFEWKFSYQNVLIHISHINSLMTIDMNYFIFYHSS